MIEDLKKLKQHGIQAELAVYLNDDYNDMKNYERAEKVAQVAAALQQQVEFVGLHWDQEPGKPSAYNDLFSML